MSRKTGISGETMGEGEAKGVENGNEDGDKGHFSEKCGEIDSAPNEEQILRDRMHKLYELRAVEIEELSKAYDRIHSLLTGSSDDPNEISEVWKGREIFNEKWKNFVDIHEQYYSLLKEECQREYACSIYEGQKRRKLELDAMASEWRIRQDMSKMKLRNILGSRSSKSSKGGKSDGSASTSRMSRQSRKKEEMALAQLKLEQIKRRQILEREEQELRRKRELMEAEMEAEQAVLSFRIVSEFQDQNFPIERADKPITINKELSNSDKLSTDSKEKERFRGINKKIETESQFNATTSVPAQGQQSSTRKPAESQHTEHATGQQFNQEIAGVLRQVVNSPKIEYLKFGGDPLKYVTFMHNFEICLEKDNLDPDRRLQLLIQHCIGKAREAIESCINLENGYEVAKATLKANFGKPHIIAEAHVKKLVNLPDLKTADGPSLLEFARNLTTAERTLVGMGTEYTADLNHMTTLRELVKKLPMFLRAKWTERAGGIIESGHRPSFGDLVKFVQERAKLVDNEFGNDMAKGYTKPRNARDAKAKELKRDYEHRTFWTGERDRQQDSDVGPPTKGRKCAVCLGPHGVWRCDAFKQLDYEGKRKCVRENGLCNKCLDRGHIAKNCPKTRFKCLVEKCSEEHHTLMHRANKPTDGRKAGKTAGKEGDCNGKVKGTVTSVESQTGVGDKDVGDSREVNVTATTTEVGGGKVCLGVIPVKVSATNRSESVETYVLMDNGSEVSLCHEQLAKKLGLLGDKISYTLTGMTGSSEIEGQMVDIVVKSMDETFAVEIPKVKTVKQIPISPSCVAKQEDLNKWPHLRGLEIPELENGEVMLLIGIKERPNLFIPLDCKIGGDAEPVAMKYSLGWAAMGPMGGQKEDSTCSVNLTQLKNDPVRVTRNGYSVNSQHKLAFCEDGGSDTCRGGSPE